MTTLRQTWTFKHEAGVILKAINDKLYAIQQEGADLHLEMLFLQNAIPGIAAKTQELRKRQFSAEILTARTILTQDLNKRLTALRSHQEKESEVVRELNHYFDFVKGLDPKTKLPATVEDLTFLGVITEAPTVIPVKNTGTVLGEYDTKIYELGPSRLTMNVMNELTEEIEILKTTYDPEHES